ncbi:DEAD/DEAH box helicase [Aureispira anguillae]|uniref:DNA2/NAM7 family helicase n=1 Tax=Aureispira anguillae TaxID=2864201 RepID=A0A915VKD1_9BACT|nr:DNA2/NAM7 family helicase [Aureispira anguillae]BDS09530.1 DNA2/NAM7 family helicase [Aureispira anguillae]
MKNPQLAELLFREFEKVQALHAAYGDKIVALDRLLTAFFVDLTRSKNIPFTTMLSRIAFASHEHQISDALQWRIHQIRKKKKAALRGKVSFSETDYLTSLKTAAYAISAFCQTPVSANLKTILETIQDDADNHSPLEQVDRLDEVRVMVVDLDPKKEYLICKPFDAPESTITVQYNVTGHNENFNSTIQSIRQHFNNHVTLNLIDVVVNSAGIYIPHAFVIEPDYMIDVSSIAECFQNFGAAADLYLLKKFLPFSYSIPLMLGNVANFFLDELMTDPTVTFTDTFPKAFALNPLAFATFNDSEVLQIYRKSQKHFTNLKTTIKVKLKENNISPEDCYLEPSFYSEKYGIQGRLDVWYKDSDPHSNQTAIIELKSGKPFAPNHLGLSHNHYTQTNLYDLLVRSTFGKKLKSPTYILYSGIDQDHLKPAPPFKSQQYEAIKVRNDIIAIEKKLADLDLKKLEEVFTIIDQLAPERLPQAKGFLGRDLQAFAQSIQQASPLERLYFLSFVSFTAREHQLAKTGEAGKDNRNGLAALWLSDLEEKDAAFEVLGFLKIQADLSGEETPLIRFQRTKKTNALANFRQGDIVVFYPYRQEGHNVLNDQIFKGSITAIDEDTVVVQLRYRQFNHSLFEEDLFWHIEHDMLDSSFKVQYRALYSFLQTKTYNRNLLLTLNAPQQTSAKPLKLGNPQLSTEQRKVLHKAIAAKDYFLLVGPPGTGKTKFMLAEMVRYLLNNTQEQILLLAYTNRAVDEICEAIHSFAEEDYLRIGSKYSTDPHFHGRLFSEQTKTISKRKDLVHKITSHRIFVSTVASIASKASLLKLKKFDTAIIDEASQILEPMLIGMLPYFKRFVLIGDHKQLPAVVLQEKTRSAVDNPALHAIGLFNRRNSLFERLYNQAKKNNWSWAFDRLSHQGRMHGDICQFPSQYFYNGQLKLLPEELPISVWQKAPLQYKLPTNASDLEQQLIKHRMLFFNSTINRFRNPKTNLDEAQIVGKIISGFDAIYKANNQVLRPEDVGVITPFRAQIAQIRSVLSQHQQNYENCTIDTVERYQGGARDIIIISLCLNDAYQLESIISLSDDELVDRKLNVALTRARKHLIIVGNEQLMRLDKRYAALIDWIQNKC